MIAVASYTSEAELKAAYRARRQRLGMEGPRLLSRREPAPVRRHVPEQSPTKHGCTVQQDHHVRVWQRMKADQASPCRNYILRRCAELGVSFEKEIKPDVRARHIVEIRDQIVYEVKKFVKPGISWPELGRLIDRDHSSAVSMYNRAAMRAGDPVAKAKTIHKRSESRKRSMAANAKAKAA
jgi:hypothetical protein